MIAENEDDGNQNWYNTEAIDNDDDGTVLVVVDSMYEVRSRFYMF